MDEWKERRGGVCPWELEDGSISLYVLMWIPRLVLVCMGEFTSVFLDCLFCGCNVMCYVCTAAAR